MQVGSLGDVVFESSTELVRTPENVSRERKARYEEHKVLGGLPRLEFVAPELATVSLAIRLRASLGLDPLREADRIGSMCKDGTVQRLVLGGVNFGNYVVDSMGQTIRQIGPNGVSSVDLSLTLKEYV